ncbi:diguanylate cyclase [Novosphingobium sp.]|uniref:GGDEF domain-containing protein n=1 Tax=Novosphingobium sp. TaxID=1874826 RepID=UPI0025ED3FAB|nr:diguanylate cyclase [Novosphingobium sp.]MCC6926014.1 diguanylate cyclase [Novosphingobium sp.]
MGALRRILIRLCLALSLAFVASAPARAATPVETCIAPLSENRALLPHFDCEGSQSRYGSGDFAVQLRFAPQVSQAADPLILRTTSVWQQSQRIVFRYADGTTVTHRFSSAQAAQFLSIGAIFEFPVPARPAALEGAYIEVTGSANWRGVVLGAELMKRSEADRLEDWLIALYAGFAGLSFALLGYNLALWRALRHRFQLTYCAMVGSLAAYTFTSSAVVMMVFPWLDNNDRLRINYILLSLAAICGLRFLQDFFGPRVISARLRRLVAIASIASLLTALAFAVLAPTYGRLLDKLYFVSGGALLVLLFPVIWSAWRARVHYFWLFMLAWSAPIGVSILRSAHGLGLIGYSFWLDNGNMIALSIESVLSTMLIVGRLRDLARERDQARASEQSALRLANSDPLTGLLNRRAFIHKAVGRAAAHRLFLVDIDHFKAINDRLGHDAGDDVLRAVAEVLQDCRPPESLAVRLGGEEFALLVPLQHQRDCPPERILAAIRAKAMPLDWKVTVSLGFADGKVSSEEDWKRLYRLADAALYRAKADGRDRACRATDFAAVGAA